MAINITIRGIDDDVRDELAARAARRGQSMQEFLRRELEAMVARPTTEDLLERIRQRKATVGTRLEPAEILEARDADRR
jgi:plasmid stability protein